MGRKGRREEGVKERGKGDAWVPDLSLASLLSH